MISEKGISKVHVALVLLVVGGVVWAASAVAHSHPHDLGRAHCCAVCLLGHLLPLPSAEAPVLAPLAEVVWRVAIPEVLYLREAVAAEAYSRPPPA
ncbi:MAG: hypothetical protein EHM65_01745 [Acidobacteriales bacterium]|nr:MAG: hypothetical protein EHM65_01745 [Terriglobales bacterium]